MYQENPLLTERFTINNNVDKIINSDAVKRIGGGAVLGGIGGGAVGYFDDVTPGDKNDKILKYAAAGTLGGALAGYGLHKRIDGKWDRFHKIDKQMVLVKNHANDIKDRDPELYVKLCNKFHKLAAKRQRISDGNGILH